MTGRTFTTQASQEAYDLANELLDTIAEEDETISVPNTMREAIVRVVNAAMDAYGDERYEDGQDEAYSRGHDDGWGEAVEERERASAHRSPMAQSWQLRFAPTGLVQGVWDADREAGTLSLVVSEWDAWTVLRVLEGAEVAR